MLDYHVHCDFSEDATGSVRDYCCRAKELGLTEVCFTTHCEPDPVRADREGVIVAGRRMPVDSDWPVAYLGEIEAARREFAGLTVRAGVEIGYEMGLEGMISGFLETYRFDFVLGAVHCLDHVAITAHDELDRFEEEFGSRGAGFVVERYFDYVRAAAGSQLFDCLAHLDIYRKYIEPLFGPEFRTAADRSVKQALEAVARSGTGLEVNTSALRRGGTEPYPEERIVRIARDVGITRFTIGSDAHRVEDLGSGLDRAQALLAGLGIRPARFESRGELT